MPSTPGSTFEDISPVPISHDSTDETTTLLSTTDELCTLEMTKDSFTTSISVPQSRLVEGSVSNERDQQRKNELIFDILTSQDKIKFWTDKERKTKKELKQLDCGKRELKNMPWKKN